MKICKNCKTEFTPKTRGMIAVSNLCDSCRNSSHADKMKGLREKVAQMGLKSKMPKSSISKLDKIFSQFIRLRDSHNGVIKCISCGKIVPWKESDCGHYINRKHKATRFDEHNCNAQCRSCNRFDEGNIQGYRKGLIQKIGEDLTELLEIKKQNTCTLNRFEINLLTKLYTDKLEEIKLIKL